MHDRSVPTVLAAIAVLLLALVVWFGRRAFEDDASLSPAHTWVEGDRANLAADEQLAKKQGLEPTEREVERTARVEDETAARPPVVPIKAQPNVLASGPGIELAVNRRSPDGSALEIEIHGPRSMQFPVWLTVNTVVPNREADPGARRLLRLCNSWNAGRCNFSLADLSRVVDVELMLDFGEAAPIAVHYKAPELATTLTIDLDRCQRWFQVELSLQAGRLSDELASIRSLREPLDEVPAWADSARRGITPRLGDVGIGPVGARCMDWLARLDNTVESSIGQLLMPLNDGGDVYEGEAARIEVGTGWSSLDIRPAGGLPLALLFTSTTPIDSADVVTYPRRVFEVTADPAARQLPWSFDLEFTCPGVEPTQLELVGYGQSLEHGRPYATRLSLPVVDEQGVWHARGEFDPTRAIVPERFMARIDGCQPIFFDARPFLVLERSAPIEFERGSGGLVVAALDEQDRFFAQLPARGCDVSWHSLTSRTNITGCAEFTSDDVSAAFDARDVELRMDTVAHAYGYQQPSGTARDAGPGVVEIDVTLW